MEQIQWYRKTGRRGKTLNKYTIQIDKEETSMFYVYFLCFMIYVYFSSLNYLYITKFMEQIQWYRNTGRKGNTSNLYTIYIDKETIEQIPNRK